MIANLTIIIPTRNRPDALRESLAQMRAIGLGQEQYLVYDDASDRPEATEQVCAEMPRASCIRGSPRVGQAQGRNVLFGLCQTPYILMMDDDTWFTEAGALPGLIERNLCYEGIGRATAVCSQVIRTYDGHSLFPRDTPCKQILSPFGNGCIVCRHDVLRAGAFRGFFRYRHEETEMGLRLWAQDFKVVYDPSLAVAHKESYVARSAREYDYLSARNLILMHALNCPGIHGLPLGLARALRLLLCRRINPTAVLKGCVDGLLTYRTHRHEATIMSPAKYRDYLKFTRKR
jgi:GT2 family glycosyltransferase